MDAIVECLKPEVWPSFVVGGVTALMLALIFASAYVRFNSGAPAAASTRGIPGWAILRTSLLLGLGAATVAMYAGLSFSISGPCASPTAPTSAPVAVAASPAAAPVTVSTTTAAPVGAPASVPASTPSTGLELFVKGIVPLMALAYFAYQAFGGALFATTSVVFTTERSKSDPNLLVVKLSVERGTQWVATIDSNAVVWHTESHHWQAPPQNWTINKLPCRQRGPLALAAGEKTATEFELTTVPDGPFYVTARVVFYAAWWPVPGECLARVRVAAFEPIGAQTSAIAPV